MCGGLADALTGERERRGHAGRARAHERLRRCGVDGARAEYRYHRLFGGLLRSRAERELARRAARAARARRRAGTRDRGAGADALRHAIAAEDWDLALQVVADHWFELYVRGDGAAVRALVDELPAERLEADAEVSAALACAALEVGDAAAAERHCAHARAAAAGLPEPRVRRYLETMALAGLAATGLEGDLDGALEAADALLAEAAGAPGRPRRGPRGRRAPHARRDRAVGAPAPRARARSSTGPSRSRGPPGSTSSPSPR